MNPDPIPITEVPEYPRKQKFFTRKRLLLGGIGIGLLMVLGLVLFFAGQSSAPDALDSSSGETMTEEQPTSIRFVATGDMIPHDALNAAAKQPDGSYDYFPFMDQMKPYFEKADIRFCNQAVLGGGPEFGITGYPVFNSPTEFARDMNRVGCNLVNTGSNHTNDKTQGAIDATVSVWDELPGMLAVAGANRNEAERESINFFEIKGVTFAFLSYTTYINSPARSSYGLTMYNESFAKTQLSAARAQADVVIVSMRWGTEYSDGINAQQTAQSQFLASNGADIVLGHGPHVLEPVKRLAGLDGRETLVWYSLGNFLNAQLEATSLFNGFAVMDIDIASKKITSASYLPVYMHYDWTAQEAAAQNLLARKNFEMVVLDDAADLVAQSQLGTTVDAQRMRITDVLNTHAEIPIITKDQY